RAKAIPGGRQIIRLDGAVAVVADHMWAAKQGLAALDIRWDDGPNAQVGTADIVRALADASLKPGVVARDDGDAVQAMAGAARKIEAVYELPFLAHATLEPVNCVVRAVQIAQQVSGPVKVVWTREEDIQHDMYRPYYYDRIAAGLDAGGKPVAWTHRVTGSSIMARVTSELFPKNLRVIRAV